MNKTDCQHEELISALVDRELTVSEEIEVREHLADCDSCQRLLERFRALDATIHQAHIPARPALRTESPIVHPADQPHWQAGKAGWSGRRNGQRRNILAGGTAVALAGIAAAVVITGGQPDASEFAWSPAPESAPEVRDVVAPLSRMAVSNEKSRRQQEYLARTLKLQLRTLKLTARNKNTNSEKLKALESDIDQLIQQLQDDYPAPDKDVSAVPAAL